MIKLDIKNLFNPQHILHVGNMRAKFFASGSFDGITDVREEILHGWKVSYDRGYRTPDFKKPVVTDLYLRTQKEEELLAIAVPYMERLYTFLQNDTFWITLLDRDGVILKLVGSDTMLKELAATGLIEGSNRGSDAPYGGLFHLVFTYKKPFILVSTEHASSIDDNLAGGACPIIDPETKEILGFIAVSGHWWYSHQHTLGLAVIAAEAISKQYALEKATKRLYAMSQSLKKVNSRLYTTLDSIKTGIIYCNEEGNIKVINEGAVKLLGIRKELKDVPGTNVCPYFDSKLSMDKIAANTKNGETYCYELVSSGCPDFVHKRNYLLYCYIRRINIGEKEQEYIITLSKQTEAHLNATKMIYAEPTFSFDDIIGSSDAIRQVKTIAELGAAHNPSILITGESGTGKELFAQSIHNASSRRNGPFVAINCGAIPRTLIESELFGYEKGAFTGADKKGHPGKFELANGGTLFLDEIGDMPYDVQVTLLRVLQTQTVTRIGGAKPIQIDVRIISATNKDLRKCIENHTFREDLYYRLNVFTIPLPPLRERGRDIEEIARYFLTVYNKIYDKHVADIEEDVLRAFHAYRWPGNIRELENVMERAVILCKRDYVTLIDIPDAIGKGAEEAAAPLAVGGLLRHERERIEAALREYKGNMSHAAKGLGMSRPTLYKRVKEYGIDKQNFE